MGALAAALTSFCSTLKAIAVTAVALEIGRQTVNHPAHIVGEKNMRLLLAAAILSLSAITACSGDSTADSTAAVTATATADSAQTILDRHVAAMKAGDLEAVMADYADNAVVIAPNGIAAGEVNVGGFNVFDGKANISRLFAVLAGKDNTAAMASMTTTYEFKGNDVVLMPWVQFKGEPNEASGTDVWVIRDGKVQSQTVLPNAAPTR
jgi:ABC-type glycerol-3-phosphate transport system substrate-binding protein